MKHFNFKNTLLAITVTVGLAFFASIAATAAPLGVSIGAVRQTVGETFARGAVGVNYEKNTGDLVGAGEILSTGKNSSMTVHFMDATTMTLGSEAEVAVDELVYDPDGNQNDNSLVISLAQGTYYYASGNIKKENITILTPTATIGIRGTELAIKIDSDGATSVGVIKGAAIMRARNHDSEGDRANARASGRSIYINIGSTGRIEKSGELSTPFGGIDLTGDDEVDRKIPGVAEWIDHEEIKESELAHNDNIKHERMNDHGDGDDTFDDKYQIAMSEFSDDLDGFSEQSGASDDSHDSYSSENESGDDGDNGGDDDNNGGDDGDSGGDDDGGDSGNDHSDSGRESRGREHH